MATSADTSLKLWVVINRAARAIETRLRVQVEGHGLSMTEFGVLEALLHKGDLPIGELGSRVLRTSGSMTYVVDKLEGRGLLERRFCAHDRRVVYAALTAAGASLIQTVFAEHAALLAQIMNPLSPEEQQTATALLKRVGLHVQHAATITV